MEKIYISEKKEENWFSKVKDSIGYIVLWISDVLNTLTPPWFEWYLATEVSKINNWSIVLHLLKEDISKEVREALSSKLIRWVMREEWYKRSYWIVRNEILNNK